MSMTLTLTQPVADAKPRRLSLMSFFAQILDGVREGQAIEARYDALTAMANSDLTRRGMTRSDITQAALTGWNA
jgi:hypothetical protein